MERLVAAAIQFKFADTDNMAVMMGKRHADVLFNMYLHNIKYDKKSSIQGFWTDSNRFVDRYEAKRIAVAAKQLIVPEEQTFAELFSEDVW